LERHKIRLPNEISSRIPSLAKANKSVTAAAVPGPFGGIQIIFGEPPLAKLRNQIDLLVRHGKATPERAGENWALLARYVSNVWEMTFSFYEKRYTVVLPSVARDIGLVPKSQSENVIIFVCGEIFEIWSPDAWVALSNSTRLKVGLLEEDLQESEAEDSQ
jgi:hypothetical protein